MGVDPERGGLAAGPIQEKLYEVTPGLAYTVPSPANKSHAMAVEFRTLSIHVTETRHAGGQGKGEVVTFFEQLTFHSDPLERIFGQFGVDPKRGLDKEVATRNIARDGKNVIVPYRPKYFWKLMTYVFGGFCSILWIGVIVFFVCWRPPLSNPPSSTNLALAILLLIVIFSQAGFFALQDFSTNRVMNSILDLLPSECVVIREGETLRIPASDLAVGDVVKLSVGNKVPADLRLFETSGDVRFDRAVLTGESEEIDGNLEDMGDTFLEAKNIALMGTHVTNGHAKGIVVLTGTRSVMGRISKLTNNTKEKPTIIQREINRFITIIVCLTVALAALITIVWATWIRVDHHSFMDLAALMVNVMGCVVAFIPEGLPIAVTMTLSKIARRMKKVMVLPKSLATVETLGCVTVFCSDKTGTLTQNRMSVITAGTLDNTFTPDELQKILCLTGGRPAEEELHKGLVLCNGAIFDAATIHLPIAEREVNGDATDGAVLRFVESVGPAQAIRDSHNQIFQIPFNSKNKWMLTMYCPGSGEKHSECTIYAKGAPDVLLPLCTSYWSSSTNNIQPFDATARARLVAKQEEWSRRGQRVIMLCTRTYEPQAMLGSNDFGPEMTSQALANLTVIGLVGIMDPPRPEITFTVSECRRAGCRFFMVTGDFGLTAAAIARQIGIITCEGEPDVLKDINREVEEGMGEELVSSRDVEKRIMGSLVLEGKDLIRLTEEHWNVISRYEEIVFARTTPEQKLRIVTAFQMRDNVVAVTGDGVNDAPALKAADVGVAMVSGSDVAIEASDLVLMGSFASITEGIRLGRLVFQNLQKAIGYLLPAGSYSEIWPVLTSTFLGLPLPLTSFLMIVICCFTDLAGCLSLVMEKEEFDLLSLPPRNHRTEHLVTFRLYAQCYLFIGTAETIIAHSMYFFYYWHHARIPARDLFLAFEKYSDGFHGYTQDELNNFNWVAQSVYFVTLVILQWGNLLSVRNKRLSILQADPFRPKRRNPWMFAGMLTALVIAIFVTEVSGIQNLFNTARVPMEFWLIPIPLAMGVLALDEVRKLLVRAYPNGPVAKMAW